MTHLCHSWVYTLRILVSNLQRCSHIRIYSCTIPDTQEIELVSRRVDKGDRVLTHIGILRSCKEK